MTVLVVALCLTACSARHHFPAAPATPQPAPTAKARPAGLTPDAACGGFARAINTHDTTRDLGPGVAYVRARPYVTGRLAVPVSNDTASDAQWQTWRAHRAVTHVAVTPAPVERPPDTATLARRAAVATVTPVGADGWHGTTVTQLVFCQLTRTAGGGWLVDAYTTG